MNISRRALLAGAGACTGAGVFSIKRAHAAEFTYKYAHNLPVTHPMHIRATEAAEKIKTETGGRFELQVYPDNQLGSDTDVLSQLRSGAVEFFTLSGLILATLVPAASINGLGFAFPDYDTVWKAMDGDLGAYIRGQIGKAGLVAMEKIWDNGFRQITSSIKPIQTPADLKGFKIRVPVSPLWTSMFKAFGSAPASINISETYSALQTGVVEGQENPLAVIATKNFQEVQKYCSLTNHMWDGYWFIANKRAYEAIPDGMRAIVTKNINAAGMAEREDVYKLNASLQSTLTAKGMMFNKPDPAPFREALQKAGFYAEWRGKYGDEAFSILEKAVGKLP
jgi:TRAP-type transport system periplasmic protein